MPIDKILSDDEIFSESNFEPENITSKLGIVVESDGVQISQFSPEWNDYVLSLLEADELEGDYPKVDGLRRVAQFLYGPFAVAEADIIDVPTMNNGFTATARYTILTMDGKRRFTEVADCNADNTEPPFCKHAASTASTKAEGRALRKLLNIKKASAEEIVTNPPEMEDEDAETVSTPIKDFQINRLNILCSRCNINVIKYINSGTNKYSKIEEVPYSIAKKMFSVLAEYQRDLSKVPPGIVGYDENWRNSS